MNFFSPKRVKDQMLSLAMNFFSPIRIKGHILSLAIKFFSPVRKGNQLLIQLTAERVQLLTFFLEISFKELTILSYIYGLALLVILCTMLT
jgi:hypothetical protein